MLQTGLFLQEKVSSCMKFAKISENSNRNFGKRKPLKRSNFKGFGWRSRWDSNPRAFWANGFQAIFSSVGSPNLLRFQAFYVSPKPVVTGFLVASVSFSQSCMPNLGVQK